MVQTAEADVVSGTVAGDNPLRACYQEAFVLEYCLADVATACFAQGHEFICHLAGYCCTVTVVEPLLSECLDFVGALAAAEGSLHQVVYALVHFFGGNGHAEAEFSKVFEERVAPCRTVAGGVGGIGSRGNRTRIDT